MLTPHLGYVTDDCYRIFYDHIVADIVSWLKGEPVRVIATPARADAPGRHIRRPSTRGSS